MRAMRRYFHFAPSWLVIKKPESLLSCQLNVQETIFTASFITNLKDIHFLIPIFDEKLWGRPLVPAQHHRQKSNCYI